MPTYCMRGDNIMAKRIMTDTELRAQVRAATRRYARRRETGLIARAARYDVPSDRIIVDLRNGLSFHFPPASLPELRGADAETLADVAVDPMGVGLRWQRLDADYELTGLLDALFGSSWAVRALARVGGRVRSAAKTRASRKNGAKGGRPRTRDALQSGKGNA
jgi:hypothetical protein